MIAENAEARIRPIGTVSTAVQNRFTCGRTSVKGSTPRIETQITVLKPKPIADRSAAKRAGRDGAEEHEQVELRVGHRNLEAVDQVERVVAAEAHQIDVLREHQREQDGDRRCGPARAKGATPDAACGWLRIGAAMGEMPFVPAADEQSAVPLATITPIENQAMLAWPRGITMNAASSGPIAEPVLPPT